MLGNLPPKFRSRLSAIHLVAIVKRDFLSEYGMDPVLRPFVDDLKKLVSTYSADFIVLTMNGSNYTCMYMCTYSCYCIGMWVQHGSTRSQKGCVWGHSCCFS